MALPPLNTIHIIITYVLHFFIILTGFLVKIYLLCLSPIGTSPQLNVVLQVAVEELVIIKMENARCENI